jgi:monoterpene epsilon-lactone hydrolase
MASREFEELRKVLKPGLAVADDHFEVVREKMHAIHPTQYGADVEVRRVELGGVPAAWVSTPQAEADGGDRVLLFVHGGAFVSTGIAHYIAYAERLSRAARARVLVFEYRWAPEHPFPAALDDTAAVHRAALDSGIAADRLGFIGDSCGGGIALAALCRLRDEGSPLPACAVGLTPWFDAEQQGDAALHPRGVDPYVEAEWIRRRFRDYAGPGGNLRDPLLSPIHADLRGLPPLWLGVGQIDTTCDDSTRLAARAGRDGVEVTLEVVPEMIHGFQGLAGLFPEATQSLERAGAFVRRHIP